jgi:glycosyltransferase involved in cell wall biosynthesis
MHVTIVSPYDPAPRSAEDGLAYVGGVERVLHRQAQELAARGHEVTLVCTSGRARGEAVEGGVRVRRVPRRATLWRAPVADLGKHIPRDTELVHVPATYPFTTPRVLRFAARAGIPALLDFHFEPDPGTTVGRAAASAYRHVGPPSYPLARLALVRSLSYALSAPSLQGVPMARWRVLPNGVDAARFRPEGPAEPACDVLVVGRLVPYKGVSVLLQAAARMRPGPSIIVAGEGPLRGRLEAQARQLGVNARFLGRVPEEDLPSLYRGAKLTVLPSVNRQEAFGCALVESMACGTPVVASRLPGVEEVAIQGGLLAEPGDPASLAAALREGLQPGRLVRGPALAGRAVERFAWPVIASQLIDVYAEMLGQRAPPAPRPEVVAAARARRQPLL